MILLNSSLLGTFVPLKQLHRIITFFPTKTSSVQRAKKVVSNSPGLMDFLIGLVNSAFNLPDGQVMFFEEFK